MIYNYIGIQRKRQHLIMIIMKQIMQSDKQEKTNNLSQPEQPSQGSFDYDDDKPLSFEQPAKLDLKSFWLGDTDAAINKFNTKFNEVKKEQEIIKQKFKTFNDIVEKYRLSSLRKIKIQIDHKELYTQYLLKTRKTIEKINPTLILNIFSYVEENLFLMLAKARKISKIFNQIYKNQPIQYFLAQKDYLEEDCENPLQKSTQMCKRYLHFHRTFLYYKNIHYTQNIPQNSIKKDFEEAVNFINQIHKIVYTKKSRNFSYFLMVNRFMTKNRVVIGLSSLSLTSLVLVRKAAIIAFSNYLAMNVQERSHEQITKTKYSKVIGVVEQQNYKDTLIINTKVSNYLLANHGMNFAVFITTVPQTIQDLPSVNLWNILLFHKWNDIKTLYIENTELQSYKFQSAKMDLEFSSDMSLCMFSIIEYNHWANYQEQGRYLVSLLEGEDNEEYFSFCWVYSFQEYFIIMMPSQFK